MEITIKIMCWGTMQTRRVMVDADGTVRVWDSVAGHYTLCHGLNAGQQARIRRAAAKEVAQ
jgi:hypothetical protein